MTYSPSLQLLVRASESAESEQLSQIKELTENLNRISTVPEEDLITFWNQSPDLFAIANSNKKFEQVNFTWTQLFGWTKEELLTKSWVDFVHPSDIRATQDALMHLTAKRFVRFCNRYKVKGGDYVCLEWSATQHQNNKCYMVARPIPQSCLTCPETTLRFGLGAEPLHDVK